MPEQPFVSYLCGLAQREDRGALASLRRGAGKEPGTVAEMHPYVARWLPEGAGLHKQNVYYLVASLFAMHPQHSDNIRSLGATFRRFAGDSGSIEKRFVALLNAHREDLPRHLRHAVSLAKSKDAPINYDLLMKHLMAWDSESRWVQRNMARDFWAGGPQSELSEANQEES